MPRHNRDTVLARRADVARLFPQGVRQDVLARKHNVTQQQIALDVKVIRRMHFESIRAGGEKMQEQKVEQIVQLEAVKSEAWRGWRKSRRDAERRQAKKVSTPDGDRTETSKVEEGQSGDPRFLHTILECESAIREMHGLNAPKKIAPTTPEGDPLPIVTMIEVVRPAAGDAAHVNGQSRAL